MKTFIFLALIGVLTVACSTGPSPSNCYGRGQPGCEIYGSPRTVIVEAKIDDDYIRKNKIPDKKKYINQLEVLPSKNWFKASSANIETNRAILECGGGIYMGGNAFLLMESLTEEQYDNGLVLIKRCMIDDGYKYTGAFNPCPSASLDACRPGASVSTRSFERRLNSPYCTDGNFHRECLNPGQEYKPPIKTGSKIDNAEVHSTAREFPDGSLRLRKEMQRNNNRQMNKLLRNTISRSHK